MLYDQGSTGRMTTCPFSTMVRAPSEGTRRFALADRPNVGRNAAYAERTPAAPVRRWPCAAMIDGALWRANAIASSSVIGRAVVSTGAHACESASAAPLHTTAATSATTIPMPRCIDGSLARRDDAVEEA